MSASPSVGLVRRVWHPVPVATLVAVAAVAAAGLAAQAPGPASQALAWCAAAIVAGFATSGST